MKSSFLPFAMLLASLGAPLLAFGETSERPSLVDLPGLQKLTDEAAEARRERLVNLDRFLALSREAGTVILDTRSRAAFARKHLAGAVHLNFSDFTEEKLAAVIPSPKTRILIYCNNNFEKDPENFPTKRMELALNLPTFINLYGYGYRNVYELNELLRIDDPRLRFEGSAVEDTR